MDVHVFDQRHIDAVAEIGMDKLHRALRIRNLRCWHGVGRLFRLVEQFKDTLRRCDSQLDRVGNGGKLCDWLRELPGILDERLNVADARSRHV